MKTFTKIQPGLSRLNRATSKHTFRSATVLLLLLLSLAAPSAFAEKQRTIQRIPVDDTFVDESCGFPVSIHITEVLVENSYVDEQGVLHVFQAFPKARARLTSLATGKSIDLTITGPGKYTIYPDGSGTLVGTGNWLLSESPDHPGQLGLFLLQGRFVLSFDSEGRTTSLTKTGKVIDLCSQLAN